jgi:histidine phosphotransferase ChpT
LEKPVADHTDTIRLAATLCARICHDLSGTLGAVSGMLELLQDRTTAADETLALAFDGALAMEAQLRLLRAAWGANPTPLALPALRALAAGLPGAHRLVLDLGGLPVDSVFPSDVGRAALALLLLAAGSLRFGGQIVLAGSPVDFSLAISGPHAAWPSDLGACLRRDAAIRTAFDDPRGLALPLAILFARSTGMRLSLLSTTSGSGTDPPPLRLTSIA